MPQAISTDNQAQTELLAFISKFPSLTKEEVEMIASHLTVRAYKKGTVLVSEGDICGKCYFVIKGCLRQYLLSDGTEKTTQFYTEEQAAVFFTSYATQTKSASYLACVEDTVLIIGDPTEEMAMYKKFPKLEQITRLMMEQDFGKVQDTLTHFIASSPTERYLHLMKTRPDLLQRVPQHQLASYIGITPESLSRIRKRMAQSK
jgi:CRP-like cAMP-binding protein